MHNSSHEHKEEQDMSTIEHQIDEMKKLANSSNSSNGLKEAIEDLRELGQELNNMGLDTEEHFNDTKKYVRTLMKAIKK